MSGAAFSPTRAENSVIRIDTKPLLGQAILFSAGPDLTQLQSRGLGLAN